MRFKEPFQLFPLDKEYLIDIAHIENMVMHNPWSLNSFTTSLNENTFGFYLRFEDKPVAYLWAQKIGDEAELYKIAVIESFQRRGIAEKLLNEFFKECVKENIAKVYLEVGSKNCKALNLYKKQGFTGSGRRKNYYGKGNDALLLVCNL